MVNKSDATAARPEREVILTRVYDAPRERVFKAWTDAKQLAQWWGPHYFTNPVCELDVRPGGTLRIVMRGPDGVDYPMKGIFREIVEPERLVFTNIVIDQAGNHLAEGLTIVTFAEHDGKTKLTVQTHMVVLVPEAAPMLEGMEAGWTQSLERLEERVTNTAEQEFTFTRVFDAPRDLVFKAWTEAERLTHWWGPKGCSIQVRKLDLRPGGIFLYSMRVPDGREMWGKFVYREIAAPERLVFVVSFTDEAGNPVRHPMSPTWPLEVLSTLTFAEHEGRTTLTMQAIPLHASELERETFEAGHESMRMGWGGSLDQLAEYLPQA
ncbi:MAG TPA: SRPBCC family protein [Gemmataceae bacterium]|nr:SRPBCC family protein [Gemmataceae bacterium]